MNQFANCWFYAINFTLHQNALNFTNTRNKTKLTNLADPRRPIFPVLKGIWVLVF